MADITEQLYWLSWSSTKRCTRNLGEWFNRCKDVPGFRKIYLNVGVVIFRRQDFGKANDATSNLSSRYPSLVALCCYSRRPLASS